MTPTSANCSDVYPLSYETPMSKDYDGYYYALSGDGSRHPTQQQQHIATDLDYISAPNSPRMFVSPTDSSGRSYLVEDPLSLHHFDSSMIDLSNPSEIFQFDKTEVVASCDSFDVSMPTSHTSYADNSIYPQTNYDLGSARSRLDFSYP